MHLAVTKRILKFSLDVISQTGKSVFVNECVFIKTPFWLLLAMHASLALRLYLKVWSRLNVTFDSVHYLYFFLCPLM